MKVLIKNGRIIDPANNRDEVCDILAENNRISQVAKNINVPAENIIDATDKIVMPGIVDMHVHLREPGREDKETIATATKAALRGGVTSVLAMPNTQPAMDSEEQIKLLKSIIQKTAHAQVFICATITRGRRGKELTDILSLKKEGIVAISDDGDSVESEGLMLRALQKARKSGILVISHCEDKTLSSGGVVNLGIISTRLGLRGISSDSEYKRVQRDLRLAEKAKASIHIAHVSCKESVELIAQAKKKGLRVTAEATPHHFSLSEEALLGFDTNIKMNPPLRSKADVEALKQGLKSGVIDAIASDHAPHTENEKEIEFERAEFGTVGLETELAASITELLNSGLLDWSELVKKLCLNPAKILGIDKPSPCMQGLGKGTLSIGCAADIIVVSPDKEWIVKKEDFLSKSKNSAFLGKKLTGVVEYTICSGKIAYTSLTK
jgi:dihydroorotase